MNEHEEKAYELLIALCRTLAADTSISVTVNLAAGALANHLEGEDE